MDMEEERKEKSSFPPPQSGPWLVFHHGKRGHRQTFFSLRDGINRVTNIPNMRRQYCLVSSNGWLLLHGRKSNDCSLLNPLFPSEKIQLPPWNTRNYFIPVLSYSSETLTIPTVVFIRTDIPFFFFWRPNDREFTKQEYNHLREDDFFTTAMGCGNKIYALTLKGMVAVIDFFVSYPIMRMTLFQPEISESFFGHGHRNYLLESSGDIFLVTMIIFGLTESKVRTLHVFRLDFTRMAWVQVYSLDGRVFVIDVDGCMSCSADEESGFRGDCIYFTQWDDESLYMFDVVDGSLTLDSPFPNLSSPWLLPYWLMPNQPNQSSSSSSSSTSSSSSSESSN